MPRLAPPRLLWLVAIVAALDQSAGVFSHLVAQSPSQAAQAGKTDEPKSDKPKDRQAENRQAEKLTRSGEPQRFVRVRRDAQNRLVALETAVASYVPAPGSRYHGQEIRVDLVGAVHVGERAYYQRLNQRFRRYDALLFELVAPEGVQIPKGGGRRSSNPVSLIQGGMKDLLKLEFQLEQIDYTQKNFVHADMTPQEFAKSMKDRGESLLQIAFRAFGRSMTMQAKKNAPNEFSLLLALMSSDRERKLKRLLAVQMEDVEDLTEVLAGKDGSSTIIGERNRKALEVMERELKEGRKNLGIFYGAGHLADLERRLIGQYGMRRTGIQWETAWNLR